MAELQLTPGLYLVATPIGSARDITLRAIDILENADVIAAEDTRNTRKLMEIHGIPRKDRPIIPYHDHNGAKMRPKLLGLIAEGKSVAYVSDAGTPLVADPGYSLARAVIDASEPVLAAPGASAVLAALSVSGLPTDRFMFAGFLPPKAGARTSALRELAEVPSTLIFYESPKRLEKTIAAMVDVLGAERPVSICRELTKKFEQCLRGTLGVVGSRLGSDMPLKGEFVIVVGPPSPSEVAVGDLDAALLRALSEMTVKDAAREVARALDIPRKTAYNRALELQKT